MELILDCFDAAFVINADAQTVRLSKVSEELTRVGITFERFPAVVSQFGPSNIRGSELGTLLSHCGVVTLAKQRNYRNVLVLEDDIVFRKDFTSRWSQLAPQVHQLEYDLLYFYDWSGNHAGDFPALTRIDGTVCTHAYCIAARYYDAFLKTLIEYKDLTAIDQILLRVYAEKWATVPNLVGQRAGLSTTANKQRPLRWSAKDG